MATDTAPPQDATKRLQTKKQTLDDAYAPPANYLEIDVGNPMTHGVARKRYTDYEVRMRTNLPVFKNKESTVRRRYSDFEWLRSELERDSKIVVPPLPGKAWKRQLPFRSDEGIFDEEFIEERKKGLELFINKVAGHPLAQNERCLHMFLQEPVLPEKGRFYELARRSRPSLESARKEPGCAYKLCAQCLTPVQVASAGPKGILCSVPCLEAFMRAKEARQNVRVSFRDGTRVPAYTLPSGQPLQSQPQPQPRDELGRNLPEDVYSFIQEVARIQALGHTVRTDGLPMVFKQDGSNAQARSLPIELLRIAMDVGKPTKSGNAQQQQPQQQTQRVEIIKRVPTTTGERVSARPVMLSGGRKVLLVQRRDPPPPAPQRGSAAWR
ncbi:hypothetical protein HPB52_019983 [Rhipicephalus sanguineus]|uniref:Sorting nexin-3 n=1 Tax=Rhipicephalus sanguineus TaxID=34632 RepID=A0A9D4PNN7_RHISA|nr:hypothetical protein HPB52_019983 [Rhipicephalus sanguineus]